MKKWRLRGAGKFVQCHTAGFALVKLCSVNIVLSVLVLFTSVMIC